MRQTITEKSEQIQRLNVTINESQKTIISQKHEIESLLEDKKERKLENLKLLGQLQEARDSIVKKNQVYNLFFNDDSSLICRVFFSFS